MYENLATRLLFIHMLFICLQESLHRQNAILIINISVQNINFNLL